ncbi:MAG: hypothetical protein QM504_03195 [Pseudomonadota bacterium]
METYNIYVASAVAKLFKGEHFEKLKSTDYDYCAVVFELGFNSIQLLFGNSESSFRHVNNCFGCVLSVKELNLIVSNVIRSNLLWDELGDVPCDDEGLIEEAFLVYPKGTDREEIWAWFESEFKISVSVLYMGC